jgi:hypothetical protein
MHQNQYEVLDQLAEEEEEQKMFGEDAEMSLPPQQQFASAEEYSEFAIWK